MTTKLILVFILFLILLMHDGPKLKTKSRKIKMIYTMIILVSFYLSIDFIMILDLYNVVDLLHDVMFQPANQIVNWLKAE